MRNVLTDSECLSLILSLSLYFSFVESEVLLSRLGRIDSYTITMLMQILRSMRSCLRALYRKTTSHWRLIPFVVSFLLLEVCVHVRKHAVTRPAEPLDAPFYTGCQDPVLNNTARTSAVLLMLARNTEVDGTIASVRSVQEQFNGNFGYPWVFLNDAEWSEEFKVEVGQAVGKAVDVKFEKISKDM